MIKRNPEAKEVREERLQKKRDYYERNKSWIRPRDNKNAEINRKKNPERYRNYSLKQQEKKKEQRLAFDRNSNLYLNNNPDCDSIKHAIILELLAN